jgi:FkbM family methyltransferase
VLSLKRLIRSRSFDYTRHYNRPGPLRTYRWKGHIIHYRPGTSDANLIYDVLLRPSRHEKPQNLIRLRSKLEYWVPPEVAPSVIMDIGGNIGLTTLYLSHLFPEARIHTFEPVPDNYALLRKNTTHVSRVISYPVALGAEDGTTTVTASTEAGNEGGYSMYGLEGDEQLSQTIEVRGVAAMMREIGLTQVDLIKIDTEGAEYDILTSMEPEILANVRWIIGELHSHRDYELLNYLTQWFDIQFRKGLRCRLSHFNACNKRWVADIPWSG